MGDLLLFTVCSLLSTLAVYCYAFPVYCIVRTTNAGRATKKPTCRRLPRTQELLRLSIRTVHFLVAAALKVPMRPVSRAWVAGAGRAEDLRVVLQLVEVDLEKIEGERV